jgi:RsiW-degrading membrane proteinase PrsW (M82 family)
MNSILLLTGLAFAPGIYLSIVIYGKDKYDREPKTILFTAFILGCLSIVPAIIIELWLKKPLFFEGFGIINAALSAFVGIGLIEELCKFFMLRVHAYRKAEFNEPFDGIVYAVFVGLGFATAENVLYVFQNGFETGILRMFTAVPAHYAFAVIMGYYVGKSKFEPANRTLHLFRAVFYAAFMHGAYDFFVLQKNYPALAIFTIGVLIMALRISKRSIEELQADSVFRFHNRAMETIPNERSETGS